MAKKLITCLKSDDVVIISVLTSYNLDQVSIWVPGLKSNAHVEQSFDPVGPKQAQVPSNERTPVMTHNKNLFAFVCDGVKKSNQVSHHMGDGELGVVIERCTRSLTIATKVWCHGSVTMIGQINNLVAPGVPELGESVKEQD
ncbi:hypothetical protein HanRHA438_Chr06g0260981 [Helianthus annuus]|nr:hypothetical protein HanRHA438_Chr06g0260981 [Helianthus annuus]